MRVPGSWGHEPLLQGLSLPSSPAPLCCGTTGRLISASGVVRVPRDTRGLVGFCGFKALDTNDGSVKVYNHKTICIILS